MSVNIRKLGNISRLLWRSFRRYGFSFALLIGLGLLGGLFQGVGIAAVIPLFYLMTGQALQGAGRISGIILWFFDLTHLPTSPQALLVLIVGLFILKSFVIFVVRYLSAHIVGRFHERMQRTILRRTLRARWPYLLQQKSGHLENTLANDIAQSAHVLSFVTNIIVTGTTFAAYAAIAITISVKITIATLIIGGILLVCLRPIFSRIRAIVSRAHQIQKDTAHHIAEYMASIKSLKAAAVERPVLDQAYGFFASMRRAKTHAALYRQGSVAIVEPLGFIVIAILFSTSYRAIGFDIASFAVIMYLVQQMFGHIQALANQLQTLNEQYPYLRATLRWRREAMKEAEHDAGTKAFSFKEALEFRDVSFGYRSDQQVLQGLSLTIPRGTMVAISGLSGGGKTTTVDLLLRLFEPTGGTIQIDGKDVRTIALKAWRRHVGYVPQDGLLLNASVRDNIRFFSDVSDADTEAAARQANIHDTIMSLPGGYTYQVGQRGVNLSGGQRQRIILARALARKPDVLILDEATSAIDAESERLIQAAIRELRGAMTIIVIAHRLSSIMDADTAAVLAEGRVVELGSPKELLENPESQFSRLHAVGADR